MILFPKLVVNSPCDGELKDLKSVSDPVFSSGMMGDGVAIQPDDGVICAPCDGTYTVIAPTGHAFGITTKDHAEVLVHIGIDTVKLEGKCFQVKKKEGDIAVCGEEVIHSDLQYIQNHGCDDIIPVLVTNSKDFHHIQHHKPGHIRQGEWIIRLA